MSTGAFAAMVAMVAITTIAPAQVLVSHTGAADPTSEGWTATGTASLGSANNASTAWSINDSTNGSLHYDRALSTDEQTNAASAGWILSVTIVVTDSSNTHNFTRYVDFVDAVNKARWGLDFGSDANGNINVFLRGTEKSVQLPDTNAHTFSLVYNPSGGTGGSGSASLFIDGSATASLTDYTGNKDASISSSLIRWGSTATNPTGSADYLAVSFAITTIPETARVATIFGMTIAIAGVALRRRSPPPPR
ncbi:MAG: hypothetical protein LBK99_19195 [Opitutaceae bacterium]|jgi:hypothetical protein|nr:hypothetical protein [Opitutaceae bacterium]